MKGSNLFEICISNAVVVLITQGGTERCIVMKALHAELDFLEAIVHAIESYAADLRSGLQVCLLDPGELCQSMVDSKRLACAVCMCSERNAANLFYAEVGFVLFATLRENKWFRSIFDLKREHLNEGCCFADYGRDGRCSGCRPAVPQFLQLAGHDNGSASDVGAPAAHVEQPRGGDAPLRAVRLCPEPAHHTLRHCTRLQPFSH